jgi:hypothetical protein
LAKERVISLRMKESAYKMLKDYSDAQGLSVNAYLNSIIEGYVEWFIPVSSYQSMAFPKRMASQLFDNIPQASLDEIATEWAKEAKNLVLLSGQKFNIKSAIEGARLISKYFMHGHMQITKDPYNQEIDITIRHEVGVNFSYCIGHGFTDYFKLLESVRVSLEFDSSTLFIRVRLPEHDYRTLDDVLT